MPRAAKTRGLRRRVDQHLHRVAALECRDTGRRIVRVDADRKRRLVIVRVVLHHLPNRKFVQTAADDRRADQPARVRRHEIHMFRREFFRSDNDIALVLAILIVHDDEHPAVFNVLDCLFNRCKI